MTELYGYTATVNTDSFTPTAWPLFLENQTYIEIPSNSTGAKNPHGAHVAVAIAVLILYVIIAAIGCVGNCTVIYVVLRDRHMRRTVTNFFIVNLALTDLVVLLLGKF